MHTRDLFHATRISPLVTQHRVTHQQRAQRRTHRETLHPRHRQPRLLVRWYPYLRPCHCVNLLAAHEMHGVGVFAQVTSEHLPVDPWSCTIPRSHTTMCRYVIVLVFDLFAYVSDTLYMWGCIVVCMQMQKMWEQHVHHVHGLCSPQFWKMFSTVREQTSECADKVLQTTRSILKPEKTSFNLGHRWPGSVRGLRDRVQKKAGCFWPNVTHTHMVRFEGGGFKNIQFSFLDPCYVWIRQCNSLHQKGHALVYSPRILVHPDTHEEVYGAGIEYGLLFREASYSIPASGYVALMNLSWDGGDTGIGSRRTRRSS